METPKRSKKVIMTTAAALGLMLGAAGVASAVGGPSVPAQSAQAGTVPAQNTPAPSTDTATTEANEANESPEAEAAEDAAEDAAEQELIKSFKVTPEEASAAALAAVPGTFHEVDVETDGATPVYEVEIVDAKGQEVDVTVDPNTGAIIDTVVEAPDAEDIAEQELIKSFKVTPEEASAAALAAVPGTFHEVDVETDGATPVYEVEIVDAKGQEIDVTVDPNTGAVINQVAEAAETAGSSTGN